MIDHKPLSAHAHTARSTKGARTGAETCLVLEPEEARALREILAMDLHRLEAEMAGNDWQDLSAAVLAKEALLRRLVGQLSV